jgi:hypothetical protein
MIAVQLFDGLVGRRTGLFKTVGPLATAVGHAVVLALFVVYG